MISLKERNKMNAYDTRFFEIVKHYASILCAEFRWVSCHVLGDGKTGISYREFSGRIDGIEHATPSKTMPAADVIASGRMLEARQRPN
jgi:hypothetical protein